MTFHLSMRAATVVGAVAATSPAWSQSVFTEVQPVEVARAGAASARSTLARIRSDAATRSVTVVRVDSALLRKRPNERVDLNVRSDVKLAARSRSVTSSPEGMMVWQGDIPAGDLPAGNATIVMNGANATGTIQAPDGRLFRLQPVGGGQNALIEVNVGKRPPDHTPAPPPPEGRGGRLDVAPAPARRHANAVKPVIDLVVAYTKSARVAAVDMKSLIALAEKETNQSFDNSGIAAAVKVVHTVEFDYDDASRPSETCQAPSYKCAFTRITDEFGGKGDGKLEGIHALRDRYGGDIAVLIVNNSSACGRAFDIGATADTAYATVHWENCATGYYSFGHEIAHLVGARHDKDTDGTDTPFAYGHGFRHPADRGGWRTIMGYGCDDGRCDQRLQYWSNPKKKHNGVAMGKASSADNARVWRERAPVIARFKTARTGGDEPMADRKERPTARK